MYQTKQKDAILGFLKKNQKNDFTSEYIMNYLKENNTPVGKTTLYRNLDNLVASGTVKKYYDDSNKRYTYQFLDKRDDCDNHFHLKCNNCGKLVHLSCQSIDNLIDHITINHGFLIDKKTILYGLCKECQNA